MVAPGTVISKIHAYIFCIILGISQDRLTRGLDSSTCGTDEIQACSEKTEPHFITNLDEWVSVNRSFNFICNTTLLTEGRECLNAVSDHCSSDMFLSVRSAQTTWEFICENRQEVISAADCWIATQKMLRSGADFSSCGPSYCTFPKCLYDLIVRLPDCTEDNALLIKKLETAKMSEIAGCANSSQRQSR